MKILFMDLENVVRPEHIFHPGQRGKFGRAAGFCADLAYILVFGYKWLGQEANSIQLTAPQMKKDPFNDKPILLKALEIMSQADVVITWYGSGHDMPFLQSRLAKAGLYMDPKIRHIDLYKVARSKLRLSSNRLDSVASFFNLPAKMKVSSVLWSDCWAGKHTSLLKMAEYCKKDCDVLEGVYHKLIQLGTALPHVGKFKGLDPLTSCQTCGSTKLMGNGYRVTKLKRYHRLRCQDCGGHQKGEEST